VVLAVRPVSPVEYEKIEDDDAVVDPTVDVSVETASPGSVPYSKYTVSTLEKLFCETDPLTVAVVRPTEVAAFVVTVGADDSAD
jgi:hypothetical protein